MIVCTSCTIKTPKLVKTLVITDKETGKEVALPDGHHIEGTGDKIVLVQRIAKVLIKDGKKSLTWESKENPRYTVENGERTINQESDKTFNGTKLEAEEAGWVSNEFGFVCPECTGDGLDEDGSSSVNPFTDDLVSLAVLASLKNVPKNT
jgi:hypothetical protein